MAQRDEHAMMADGHSTRRKFYLYPEHLWFLPAANRAVLREVARLMMAPETQAAFKQKFRAAIERNLAEAALLAGLEISRRGAVKP